jgi:hypothetical protein
MYIYIVSGITLAAPNPSLPRQRLFTWWSPQKVESPSNKLPSKQGFQSLGYHVQQAGHSFRKIDRDRMAASALDPYLAHHGLSSSLKH